MSSTVLQEIQIRCMKLSGLKKNNKHQNNMLVHFINYLERDKNITRVNIHYFLQGNKTRRLQLILAVLQYSFVCALFSCLIFKQPMSSTKGQQMSLDKTLYFYQCWMSEFICQLKIKIWFCNSLSIFVFPMSIKVIYL